MSQTTTVIVIILCLIINKTLHESLSTDEMNENDTIPDFWVPALSEYAEKLNYLILTPGCSIPDYGKTIFYKKEANNELDCGKRIVFVNKVTDRIITFHIIKSGIKRDQQLNCCYSFMRRSKQKGLQDYRIIYSNCRPFKHGDKVLLLEEYIVVKCFIKQKSEVNTTSKYPFEVNEKLYYKDAYFIIKKKTDDNNHSKTQQEHWNVLLIGMDGMSRNRAHTRMADVVYYLQEHSWLDYRGFHKTGDNTFPNMMSVLTGLHPTEQSKKCDPGMDECRDLLIWRHFKKAGYVTAFGEDQKQTFYHNIQHFSDPPTDHYFRPIVLTGERDSSKYLKCVATKPTFLRVLSYAAQFARTYKNDKFFGHFWTSTFSHDPDHTPSFSQHLLLDMFKYLLKIGVLRNTFVVFFGDHGINYGENRQSRESYYDSKLPMLFMWVPLKFREAYPEKFFNLQLNQYRLATHFDLHATLWTILKMSNSSVQVIPPKACPTCQGLTEEISPTRTCAQANIEEKWCACHGMNDVTGIYNEVDARRSFEAAFNFIRNQAATAKTRRCTTCSQLEFEKMLWSFLYRRGIKKYLVMAFILRPRHVTFEAKIEVYKNSYTVLNTEITTPFKYYSYCAKTNKVYCDCIKKQNCIDF